MLAIKREQCSCGLPVRLDDTPRCTHCGAGLCNNCEVNAVNVAKDMTCVSCAKAAVLAFLDRCPVDERKRLDVASCEMAKALERDRGHRDPVIVCQETVLFVVTLVDLEGCPADPVPFRSSHLMASYLRQAWNNRDHYSGIVITSGVDGTMFCGAVKEIDGWTLREMEPDMALLFPRDVAEQIVKEKHDARD